LEDLEILTQKHRKRQIIDLRAKKYSTKEQRRTEIVLKMTAGKEREYPDSPETSQAFENSPQMQLSFILKK